MRIPVLDWPQVALVLGLAAITVLAVIFGPEELHAPIAGLLVTIAGLLRSPMPPAQPPGSGGDDARSSGTRPPPAPPPAAPPSAGDSDGPPTRPRRVAMPPSTAARVGSPQNAPVPNGYPLVGLDVDPLASPLLFTLLGPACGLRSRWRAAFWRGFREGYMRLWPFKPVSIAVLVALALTGCGASALRVQALAADTTGRILDATCAEVETGRAHDLETLPPTREEAHAYIDETVERWAPAVDGCNVLSDAHGAWADVLVRAASGAELDLGLALALALRISSAWPGLTEILARVHVALPPLPAQLASLGGAQ